ncbi:DASS family sodium-coupled anion symporter [Staphylococcus pseudintermedius]|uniref:SLC13 family permease n=1 Tax=Staphylococcus pseudintermedius TaxID=283734 RepID=UPI0018F74C85|nr:DASS family sodium-coupled anion symporter [Staphylococcus pseudintermedius]EGQ0397170.1 DASS family sodium-coupled anion symporter [Staphylococcus pseudintermedius]EGQ1283405.1 DASS family sodium-coupled anion symporter [Staphylococcus pseudintermedius]EGQ1307150.1 DASS family sodium-coupled anion symporter [Staphylococcus pseudintermedius]EGQ1313972.1 DASS family sodium-coupled anion symporter [Staphylococcus pseudintermedius]EGQ1605538.1 DASS family sodium-coupled anion symporter [Staphy
MATTSASKKKEGATFKPLWFILSFVTLIVVLLMPTPASLPLMGKAALAILAFAVILWVTEAVTYPVSATIIVGLIILLLGFSPVQNLTQALGNPQSGGAVLKGDDLFGTGNALKLAFSGFSTSAVALVAAALFLATAMQVTNLHKRLALLVLSFVGNKTKNIVIGAILVSIILAFFVPSATARAGAVVPILLGMIAAFGATKNSKLAALLIITAVQAVSIWNIGIKTAAAQNIVAINFINDQLGHDVSWGEWFLYAAPWSIIMSIVLYFVMLKVIPPEQDAIEGGTELVKQQLAELGPVKPTEWRLIIISLLLLVSWSTEKVLHPIDSSSITLIALAIMLTPKIGVMNWKEVESRIPWGTIIVFGVGISLGNVLLKTTAAQWLSDQTFGLMGLKGMPIVATIALISLFNILIHLGFASATSLASALIPVFISLTSTLSLGDNAIGFVLIQQFVISFGFLLPVSSPQSMLAYGTETFTVKDFLKAGIPITIVGYILVVIMSMTYWKWLGLL